VKSFFTYLCKLPGEDKEALIEDLQALVKQSKQQSVNKMIGMIEDLQEHGMESRFVKHLAGAIHELKARTPEGGARVYFFRFTEKSFVLTRAEVKNENEANANLINYTASIFKLVQSGKADKVLVPKPKQEVNDHEKENKQNKQNKH
jgi:phage-related protein